MGFKKIENIVLLTLGIFLCTGVTSSFAADMLIEVTTEKFSHQFSASQFPYDPRGYRFSYSIPRLNGTCQLRVDFNDFILDQGDAPTFGDCNTHTLIIHGALNSIEGPLCGDISGQHMYLEYANDSIELLVSMQNKSSQGWNISFVMLGCDSLNRAPAGCLQYFTTPTGMVQSFNYNNRVQLNNQDYGICVRTQEGMQNITWEACGTNPETTTDFIISGGPPSLNPGGDAVGTPVFGDECSLDWVLVSGENKHCGSQFPASVSTSSQPFNLQVHFNEFELPPPPSDAQADALNTGFCLKYFQSPQ